MSTDKKYWARISRPSGQYTEFGDLTLDGARALGEKLKEFVRAPNRATPLILETSNEFHVLERGSVLGYYYEECA
ncbi:MAG: hypothetical protein P1V36_01755 [Planctomycetota bacterium]|nr:hypothetical protein [Planctomycetota bacterium]